MKKLLTLILPALALTTGAPLAANESDRYGAFAIDVDVWAYAFAGGVQTQDEADQEALALCAEEGAERCELKYQYTGSRCGAAAIAEERDYLAWGFGHADTRAEAIDNAIHHCKSENTSGAACRKMTVACGALHPADDPQRALKKAEREKRKAERALKTAERKLEKEQATRQKAQADLKAAQTERRTAQSEQKKAAREQRKAERDLKTAQTAQQTAEAAKEKWKTAWEEEKTGREWAEFYLHQHGGEPALAQAQAAAKGKKKGSWLPSIAALAAGVGAGIAGVDPVVMAGIAAGMGDKEAAASVAGLDPAVATALRGGGASSDPVTDSLLDMANTVNAADGNLGQAEKSALAARVMPGLMKGISGDPPPEVAQTAQADPQAAATGEAPYGYTAAAAWGRPAPQLPGMDGGGMVETVRAMASGASSPAEAMKEALALCKQKTGGKECREDGMTTARCVAFAEGELSFPSTPQWPEPLNTVGTGTSNDTQAAASAAAVARCQEIEKINREQAEIAGYETQVTGACHVVLAKCAGEEAFQLAKQEEEEVEAEEDKPRYGAVAFTPEQGAYALAVGYETQGEADKAAWGLCNDEKARGENFCEVQAAINAPCAAIAKVDKGQTNISGDIWKPGIGSGDTKAGAIEAAISECQGQPDGAYGRPSCSLHSAVCADAEAHANIRGHLATSGEDAVRDIRGHIANLPEPEFEQKADGKGAAAPAKKKAAPPADKKTTETPENFREASKMYGSEEATE